ncbi:3-oxoacyl-[acyl-carrier-protein] reductase FabG-like [Leguminivora glycinivorella]|uniref:3-oxoacyl-[acyl-carrier-protein] reductase FabG-like n=1 Tax=Leguminivora glycinivorella TaxID=1035111 RepID=UPI00200DF0AC|nr:3-oxoacyl-[acyl-carrier-protein] reductase FabG-like [Leguminivora glycinivorella]
MDFNDKVVLITGASSGIGAATAIYFANLSAKLVLVGRKENNLRRIAAYCEKSKGIQPLTITADVTEDAEVDKIIEETVRHCGKLDVLVNNAGVLKPGGIKNSNMDNYDTVMSTNMRAVYHLTMRATPHLIESKGCIVNVSSISSTKPNALTIAYNVSKAALDQFTKCVALELAADGVRVNSVNPGFVKTNILNDTGLSEDQMELVVQNIVNNMPLKKPLQVDEVAGVIAFLASNKAKSITGSCFVIDGGSLLK